MGTPPSQLSWRKDGLLLVLLLALGLLLRCYSLSLPYERYFDEIYYPDAAVNYVSFGSLDFKNPDHRAFPYQKDENHVHPAGKLFMAAFMEVWWGVERYVLHNFQPNGFSTISWRWGSLVLNLCVIIMSYMMALSMFKHRLVAFLAAFFVTIDMLEIVQSRIAMLDAYEAFWIMAGLLCTWYYIVAPPKEMKWAWWASVAFGFGVATKWSTLFAMLGAVAAVFLLKDTENLNGRNPWLVRLIDTMKVFGIGVLMTVSIYALVFFPLLRADHYNLRNTWQDFRFYHVQMWVFRHDPKQFKHRYLSQWWEWPICRRPIWYIYHEESTPNYSRFAAVAHSPWFERIFGPMEGHFDKWVYGAFAMGSVWTWYFFLLFLFVVLIRMLLSLYFLVSSRCYTRPPPDEPEARITWEEWRDSWKDGDEKGLIFCVLTYFPQVLLWAVNPGFFFYMLPVVPLMCTITGHTIADWREMKIGRLVMAIFIGFSLLWTLVYWPLETGYPVPKPYFEKLMLTRHWI